MSHRDYTTAFYYGKPDGNQQVYTNNSYIREYDFIGMVQEDWNEETGFAWVEQRNKFSVGTEIEVMPAQGILCHEGNGNPQSEWRDRCIRAASAGAFAGEI